MRELSASESVVVQGGVNKDMLTYVMAATTPFCFFIFSNDSFNKMIGLMAIATELVGFYGLSLKDEME